MDFSTSGPIPPNSDYSDKLNWDPLHALDIIGQLIFLLCENLDEKSFSLHTWNERGGNSKPEMGVV